MQQKLDLVIANQEESLNLGSYCMCLKIVVVVGLTSNGDAVIWLLFVVVVFAWIDLNATIWLCPKQVRLNESKPQERISILLVNLNHKWGSFKGFWTRKKWPLQFSCSELQVSSFEGIWAPRRVVSSALRLLNASWRSYAGMYYVNQTSRFFWRNLHHATRNMVRYGARTERGTGYGDAIKIG